MSDTLNHKKACRVIRNKGLPENVFFGSPIRSGNTRKRDAKLKVTLRQRQRRKNKKIQDMLDAYQVYFSRSYDIIIS